VELPDETGHRRVSAVFVADVCGFSTLVGEDDERAAREVRRVQAIVRGVVSDLAGRAEPQKGDSIFASFDSVVAAVEAALRIQRTIAADAAAEGPLRLRIGVHLGDVLHLSDGSAVGDAINIAARLCALARPGTICISEAVYRQVRKRVDAPVEELGRRHLKNISDAVRAWLIVPQDVGEGRRRRTPLRWAYAGGGVLAILIAAWLWSTHSRGGGARVWDRVAGTLSSPDRSETALPSSVAERKTVIGVMPFSCDQANSWMGLALRAGLNNALSRIPKVTVYSKEWIDFQIEHEGFSEIGAANKLGIGKLLSGSVVVVNDQLEIEMHIVDMQTGRLDASVSKTGRVDQFLVVQAELTEALVVPLHLPISAEEGKQLQARQSTNQAALQRLLEAEGGAGEPAATPEPESAIERWLAWAVVPRAARADDSHEILDVIEHYRRATESREASALADYYLEFTPKQQAAQQRYFDGARNLKVRIDDVKLEVQGDDAIVMYTRTDDFDDSQTGVPMHLSVRLTKNLRRTPGGWKLAWK
jgi:class 3 adenylate cyclase/ketosteroid isomerase-like protein/TolB-like protein